MTSPPLSHLRTDPLGRGGASSAQEMSEDKLRAVHERLTAAVADLTRADAWQQMLQTAAKFHQYSPMNVLLVASQHPGASAVAGFHTWRQLGRQVRKGEKGIAILAPVLGRSTASTAALDQPPADSDLPSPIAGGPPERTSHETDGPGAAARRRVAGFRVVHVFDISQTDGPDLPTAPAPVLLDGAAPTALYDGLVAHVRDEGFGFLRHDLTIPHLGEGRANGVTDYFARTVIVAEHLPPAQATKTLAHELGHVLLHRPDNRPDDLTRPRAEVEAESVAYVVTAAHGLDSADYTVPYVTGWAGGDLTLVQQTAERVLATAQTILRRTPPPATHSLPEGASRSRDLIGTGRDQTAANRDRALGQTASQTSSPTRAGLVSPSLNQEHPETGSAQQPGWQQGRS
ncbi:MAG: serine/arginine repetitive matrix protein 2 [Frankiales bacterium]|nr:serine/arginine repetitive matrix protein 2 [Frankiales bacterium]